MNGKQSRDNARKRKAGHHQKNRRRAQAIDNRASRQNSVLQKTIRLVLTRKVLLVPIRGVHLALTTEALREKATQTIALAAVRRIEEALQILQENVHQGVHEMDEIRT